MKNNVTVVILAAGLGTRMKSRKAKVLHEAGGDTLLNHIVRAALQVAEPERIVAVVGHQAAKVQASVKTPGIRFAEQTEQRGTGHAVLCAREDVAAAEGLLLILNGDGPLLRAETLLALVELGSRATGEPTLGGAIVTTRMADPTGYGRIVRDERGMVAAIVEQKAASLEQLNIREINPGLYCFQSELFWRHAGELTTNNPAKEYYLTDMVEILARHGHSILPMPVEDETELLGINTRVELALADKILRARKSRELMLAGVTIENPDSVTIDVDVEVGMDSVLEANVHLRGQTRIGAGCRIGTGSVMRDCDVADEVTILPYVVADQAVVRARASIGPFTRMRLHADAGEDSHIGNFVELKKTKLGQGSKAGHLAYLGDSNIGAGVNIGAGTITCNYDGQKKHTTEIGEGVFVGSNSTLVAPLKIADGAYIAAGSTITTNVEEDALAIGRTRQVDKPGWAKKRRQLTASR
ncbi:MAG TPA: bifunctional UDP-N-acetylglucosamine diphosphorylase/glucosamine-1-phosphate N-acetyltransferase GlmU [Bryobacteraceae bacterium]|nr:bifunctional UDP-N-acetylglucosamine diphosphorylase/glucosamine-1-phosphate N-acetyltransferase GlmU [Bryobacteraceae bacterium]